MLRTSFSHTKRLILIAGLFLTTASAWAFDAEFELSRAELQQRVEKMFPVNFETPLFQVIVETPVFELHPRKNRLALNLTVKTLADGVLTSKGRGQVDGRLIYVAGKGEFYLDDAVLTQLSIDPLTPEVVALIKDVLNAYLPGVFANYPVYVLDDSELRQKFLKKRLISVEVRDGKLFARYSL